MIDIDERESFSGIRSYINAGYEMYSTVSASTPRGGIHLYFKAPSFEVSNSVSKLAEGVDVRGDGGYVIAPPSITEWGEYRWTCTYKIFRQGPVPLPEIFHEPIWRGKSSKVNSGKRMSVSFRLLETIAEGSRNDEIAKRSGLLLSRYSADDALNMLKLINQNCCQPPLDEREVNQIFASISKREGK